MRTTIYFVAKIVLICSLTKPIFATITIYADADQDGYGATSASPVTYAGNTPPAGFSINNLDCFDGSVTSSPGHVDLPATNGADDNCNGTTDESSPTNLHAPVANVGSPYSITHGANLTLDGSSSTDDDIGLPASVDAISRYEWNINGGAVDFVSLTPAIGLTPTDYSSLLFAGTNSVTLQVFDRYNTASSISAGQIQVLGGPPAPPTTISVYPDVDQDGYGDSGASPTTPTGTVPVAGFSFNNLDCDDSMALNSPGHVVDLPATNGIDDNCNGTVDDSPPANAHAPIANVGSPYSITHGANLTLDGSSSTDGDIGLPGSVDGISRYEWNINGGAVDFVSLTSSLTLTQADYSSLLSSGANTVTLRVYDRYNVASSISSGQIQVSAVPEPSPMLFLLGLCVLISWNRRVTHLCLID